MSELGNVVHLDKFRHVTLENMHAWLPYFEEWGSWHAAHSNAPIEVICIIYGRAKVAVENNNRVEISQLIEQAARLDSEFPAHDEPEVSK